MTCETCGATVQIGDYPFCPHGRTGLAAIGDDIPGGFVQENFGPTPEVFYSKKAMLARADELGLRVKDEWAGPHDRVLSRSAVPTEKTLRDAAILLSRGAQAVAEKRQPAVCETLQTSVRELTIGVRVGVER